MAEKFPFYHFKNVLTSLFAFFKETFVSLKVIISRADFKLKAIDEEEQREFIIEFIRLIEDWRAEDKKVINYISK